MTLPSSEPNWTRLRSVRSKWDGPILLRGVETVEEAKRAVTNGIDGIVVSNHRGVRKGAEARGTLDALPAIAKATGKRLSVLFDSGVRTAPEAIRAFALGADAVLVGRPYVFGLALDGEAGVRHVMRTLLAELDISLGNAGTPPTETSVEPLRPRSGEAHDGVRAARAAARRHREARHRRRIPADLDRGRRASERESRARWSTSTSQAPTPCSRASWSERWPGRSRRSQRRR